MNWQLILTVVISACALVGAWHIIGFIRYTRYFKTVDGLMAGGFFGRIQTLPSQEFAILDDVVRRSYFGKQSPIDACNEVMKEVLRQPDRFGSRIA